MYRIDNRENTLQQNVSSPEAWRSELAGNFRSFEWIPVAGEVSFGKTVSLGVGRVSSPSGDEEAALHPEGDGEHSTLGIQ